MIDRRALVDEVRGRLRGRDRLVTLSGPGGVGKTWVARMATAGLERVFVDGVHVVALVDVGDAGQLVRAVARDLGGRGHEDDVPSLARLVGDRHQLLVLDGCDDLLAPCATLVAALLRACPNLRVLTTTRQPLRLAGECVVAVPPLSYPGDEEVTDPLAARAHDAVTLFVERAAAARPSFRLTEDNAAAVASVCARLEGNPLAIELAAARASVLAPQAIYDRLEDPYRLLTKGAEGAPARLRSLRASVDATDALCDHEERVLWARMSVFPSTFDLDAAEEVCSGEGIDEVHVIDLVDSLLEKSVLVREDPDAAHVRYRMPETFRAYGAERLGDEGLRRWQTRLVDWCDSLVRRAAAEWFGPGQAAWHSRFDREHENLCAAFDIAAGDVTTASVALRVAVGLEPYWLVSGRLAEASRWLVIALQHRAVAPAERVEGLALAAYLATLLGQPGRAEEMLAEARTLAAAAGGGLDGRTVIRAEGAIAAWRGRHGEAERCFRRAVQLAVDAGSAPAAAEAWLLAGLGQALADQPEAAEDAARRCVALAEEAEESQLRSCGLGLLALGALSRRDLPSAASTARDALRLSAAVQDATVLPLLYQLLALVATAYGDHARAATLFGVAGGRPTVLAEAPGAAPLAARRDEGLSLARESLGDRAFQRHCQRGASMAAGEATRYALDDLLPAQRRSDEATPLTGRELEVAELVARGMSNREIAATLVISVRTAQGHVENILRKLRFASRAQVAAWVAERRARRP